MLLHPTEDESFDYFSDYKMNNMSNNSNTSPYVYTMSNNFQDDYVSSTLEFGAAYSGEFKTKCIFKHHYYTGNKRNKFAHL